MTNKNVVIEFIVDEKDAFQVEYKDDGEWISAVGTWHKNGAKIHVKAEYKEEDKAVAAAQSLHKFKNIPVRVVISEEVD